MKTISKTLLVILLTNFLLSCEDNLDQTESLDLIESQEFTGTIAIEIADDWNSAGELVSSTEKVVLQEENSDRTIYLEATADQLKEVYEIVGSKLKIQVTSNTENTFSLSQYEVLEKAELNSDYIANMTRAKPSSGQSNNILVVFVSDPTSTPACTPEELDFDLVGTNNPQSLANLYNLASFGDFSVDPNVTYAAVTLNEPMSCGLGALKNQIRPFLTEQGFIENDYTFIMSVSNDLCSYGGIAQINNKWFHNDGCSWNVVSAHEMGHSLGLGHAAVGLNANPYDGTAYGDRSDVMGVVFKEFNAPHRIDMGWLSKKNVAKIRRNGSKDIYPLHVDNNNLTKVLSILDDSYNISYRANIGPIDNDMAADFSNRVHIHQQFEGAGTWTKILARLDVGESYLLPEGVNVTNNGPNGNGGFNISIEGL